MTRQGLEGARELVVVADRMRKPMPCLVIGMSFRRKADAVRKENAAKSLGVLVARIRRFIVRQFTRLQWVDEGELRERSQGGKRDGAASRAKKLPARQSG